MKIVMMMAMTVDGKIAKTSNHFANWTSREDKKAFAKESKKHGVVIMGGRTFRTFPSPLKDRLNVVFTQKENQKLIDGVKWVSGDPKKVLRELEQMGYKSVILGGGASLNSLFLENKLIDELIINIEPKIFGEGISLFNGDYNVDLKLLNIEKINDNAIMLRYKVVY